MPIESRGFLVLCIDHNRRRSHLPGTGQSTPQCIKKQKFTETLTAKIKAHRQATEQGGRQIRILRELFPNLSGKVAQL